jgi:hypothetical protein
MSTSVWRLTESAAAIDTDEGVRLNVLSWGTALTSAGYRVDTVEAIGDRVFPGITTWVMQLHTSEEDEAVFAFLQNEFERWRALHERGRADYYVVCGDKR